MKDTKELNELKDFMSSLYQTKKHIFIKNVYPFCYEDYATENIVFNSFCDALENLDKYDKTKASIETWFNAILYNNARTYKKDKYKKDVLVHHVEYNEEEHIIKDDSSFLKMEQGYTNNDIISSLPRKMRNIFYMHYVQGLKIKEIGDIIDFKPSYIANLLSDGRTILKNKYRNKEK